MRIKYFIVLLAVVVVCSGCSSSLPRQKKDAGPAIASLQKGDFEAASQAAEDTLKKNNDNHYAHLVRAIVRYKDAMHQLAIILYGSARTGASQNFDERQLMSLVEKSEAELKLAAEDLEKASHKDINLELCIACWRYDWNHNGRIDANDEKLFEIEFDANGKEIPQGDPRRKPVFRFDAGDVEWARAFVSFQRALLDIILAYDWNILLGLGHGRATDLNKFRLPLTAPQRIAEARSRIMEGTKYAEKARRLYLKETDDDREWVPNPRQKNHPLPLPVDEKLYETWQGILDDVNNLVKGDDGLSVAEIAQLGGHQWKIPPKGYINISLMLNNPKEIVIETQAIVDIFDASYSKSEVPAAVEKSLQQILGDYYVPEMKPSPLLKRLVRMKGEIDRRQEPLERKLRYLLWLN